eukprot:TRINITY_DN4224_c0_g1_i15.p9 TRINITY_DN4224_c0_g1~~TRINITY_DN4224_c0_g1_i15.p9  ORF type:complete len:154 (-),score=2.77 TRINITY_DN4224_c0_g1_i15:2478-2939(-)
MQLVIEVHTFFQFSGQYLHLQLLLFLGYFLHIAILGFFGDGGDIKLKTTKLKDKKMKLKDKKILKYQSSKFCAYSVFFSSIATMFYNVLRLLLSHRQQVIININIYNYIYQLISLSLSVKLFNRDMVVFLYNLLYQYCIISQLLNGVPFLGLL